MCTRSCTSTRVFKARATRDVELQLQIMHKPRILGVVANVAITTATQSRGRPGTYERVTARCRTRRQNAVVLLGKRGLVWYLCCSEEGMEIVRFACTGHTVHNHVSRVSALPTGQPHHRKERARVPSISSSNTLAGRGLVAVLSLSLAPSNHARPTDLR
jgi:hypothetical protein